jgi:hypothetical protein
MNAPWNLTKGRACLVNVRGVPTPLVLGQGAAGNDFPTWASMEMPRYRIARLECDQDGRDELARTRSPCDIGVTLRLPQTAPNPGPLPRRSTKDLPPYPPAERSVILRHQRRPLWFICIAIHVFPFFVWRKSAQCCYSLFVCFFLASSFRVTVHTVLLCFSRKVRLFVPPSRVACSILTQLPERRITSGSGRVLLNTGG